MQQSEQNISQLEEVLILGTGCWMLDTGCWIGRGDGVNATNRNVTGGSLATARLPHLWNHQNLITVKFV